MILNAHSFDTSIRKGMLRGIAFFTVTRNTPARARLAYPGLPLRYKPGRSLMTTNLNELLISLNDLLMAVSLALVGALCLSFLVDPANLPDLRQFFVDFVGP
jgi:hypothetical protein